MTMKAWISLAFLLAATASAQQSGPKTFAKPEDARDALVQAAAAGLDAVKELFGPGSSEILRTGDDVEDRNLLARFNQGVAEKTQLETDPMNPDRVTVLVSAEEWPFAVPLIRRNNRWLFDVDEGKAEVRRRIIGSNELDAIEICRGYVEAQLRYAETDWNGDGVHEYAARVASIEGKKDGLYWPGDDSPVAAGFAKAAAEGYRLPNSTRQAYHGYYYKILLAQGHAATDGARDYAVRGLMIGGFALVAWPAEYGISGIKTFIVNQDGVVYEKDLGPRTAALAKAMTRFNPEKSWQVSPEIDTD
jgi:hypothetical protein